MVVNEQDGPHTRIHSLLRAQLFLSFLSSPPFTPEAPADTRECSPRHRNTEPERAAGSRVQEETQSTLPAPSYTLYQQFRNFSENVEPASPFEKWVSAGMRVNEMKNIY